MVYSYVLWTGCHTFCDLTDISLIRTRNTEVASSLSVCFLPLRHPQQIYILCQVDLINIKPACRKILTPGIEPWIRGKQANHYAMRIPIFLCAGPKSREFLSIPTFLSGYPLAPAAVTYILWTGCRALTTCLFPCWDSNRGPSAYKESRLITAQGACTA